MQSGNAGVDSHRAVDIRNGDKCNLALCSDAIKPSSNGNHVIPSSHRRISPKTSNSTSYIEKGAELYSRGQTKSKV